MKLALMLAVLLVLVVSHEPGSADVPQTISYQGVLKLTNGSVAPDGNYYVTFRLYGSAVGADSLWGETQLVPVSRGIYNVILGDVTALDLPFDVSYWLGVSVDAGDELTPRVELTSAPYALRAAQADNATDSDWVIDGDDVYRLSGNVGMGTDAPGRKLDVVGDAKITGLLAASPRMYLVEENSQRTLNESSWTDYLTQTITVEKDDANVLFLFSYSHPREDAMPRCSWRMGLDSTFSNALYRRCIEDNWRAPAASLTFLMTGVSAGTYTARLQYKFFQGQWFMSYENQADAYNSLIIVVL